MDSHVSALRGLSESSRQLTAHIVPVFGLEGPPRSLAQLSRRSARLPKAKQQQQTAAAAGSALFDTGLDLKGT